MQKPTSEIKNPKLEIVHQEAQFIVVNKPSGLLAVPGRGSDKIDSVSHRVKKHFPHCIDQPAVHRLDMDTSGLMLLAFTQEAHSFLSIQFEKQQVSKQYIALLEGQIYNSHGKIELPFRLDIDNRPYQIHDAVHGKVGVTLWQKVSYEPPYTRVEFTPLTGRTHQLRLHASHKFGLGTPIVGDTLYGNGESHGNMKLHASSLSFIHPVTKTPINLSNPPPF